MRRRLVAATGVLFSLAAGLLLSQCFAPTYSDCAFRCGTTDPTCPVEYTCNADGYCHLPDSTAVCAKFDLAPAVDLSTADAGTD